MNIIQVHILSSKIANRRELIENEIVIFDEPSPIVENLYGGHFIFSEKQNKEYIELMKRQRNDEITDDTFDEIINNIHKININYYKRMNMIVKSEQNG